MKCPICTDYFIAGVVKFQRLRVIHKTQPRLVYNDFNDEYIRVCPKCFKDNDGVLIK